jgi:hypothetical protein
MQTMKSKRQHNYWSVVIVYTDNETSGNHVFNDLARLNGGLLGKKIERREKCRLEAFVRETYRWREPR